LSNPGFIDASGKVFEFSHVIRAAEATEPSFINDGWGQGIPRFQDTIMYWQDCKVAIHNLEGDEIG